MDELKTLRERIEELIGAEETIRNERQDLEAEARRILNASFLTLGEKQA